MADTEKGPNQPQQPSTADAVAAAKDAVGSKTTADIMKELQQMERTTGGSGAIPLAPKQQMLDARDVQAKHPDLKLRWVNIKDPQRAAVQMMKGYRRLTAEEGGRALGDELALFGVSRAEYDRRIEHNQKVHAERLTSHRREMENMAEAVARELRDRHGIRVSSERILVNEEGR